MNESSTIEAENRRERQALIERNTRLESLSAAYREMTDVRESEKMVEVIMRGARTLAPRARIGIIERGVVLSAEDRLGQSEMNPNPEWRIVSLGEGHADDLVAPLFDGRKKFISGVMGASRGVLYIDDLDEIDEHLRSDFLSYIRFAGVAIAALSADERNRKAAMTDALTGIANRRALEITVSRMVNERRRFAYVIIDLDNFKQINDKKGHAAGDMLLKRVGEVLANQTRANDFPARLAGDEFVVLLVTGDVSAGATRVGEWLAKNGIQASTGIARFPEDGQSPQELYTAADAKLYANKKERRDAGLR